MALFLSLVLGLALSKATQLLWPVLIIMTGAARNWNRSKSLEIGDDSAGGRVSTRFLRSRGVLLGCPPKRCKDTHKKGKVFLSPKKGKTTPRRGSAKRRFDSESKCGVLESSTLVWEYLTFLACSWKALPVQSEPMFGEVLFFLGRPS